MKIDSLKVKNFKSIEDVEVVFDGYFTSISGRNNAGKTTLIKSIRRLLKEGGREYYYPEDDEDVSYAGSKTQWIKGTPDIEFEYKLNVSREFDPGLYSFVEKIAELDSLGSQMTLRVVIALDSSNERTISIFVDETKLDAYPAKEIYQRINSSNLLFMHNSTDGYQRIFFHGGPRSFHEMMFSKDEKEELKKEQTRIRNKIKKFAQKNRGELSGLLGRLEDKYEVELTIFERMFNNAVPVGINLRDKSLEVPLEDWGSGTQNRTHILMSVLSASRIQQQKNDENRVTPIIVVEEPESFLHPSAQAEFGRVLRSLARELKIQTIITTHSPYMLCQEQPESNVLLDRKVYRGHLRSTQVVDVNADKWMEPFSDILGLNDDSLKPWQDVVGASQDKAILVEGEIDKAYLDHISGLGISGFTIPEGVEVISYGGKDALKNSIMLKFVVEKFDRTFITFDLDAKGELEKVMNQLALVDDQDYAAVGKPDDGKDCIEGLLTNELHASVYAKRPDLVQKMSSADAKKRRSAKNKIKELLLAEFRAQEKLDAKDLAGFKPLFSCISKAFK